MLKARIKSEDVPDSLKNILKLNGENLYTKRSPFMKAVLEDNREKLAVFFEKAKKENVNLFNYIYDRNISVINMLLSDNRHVNRIIKEKIKAKEDMGEVIYYSDIAEQYWNSRITYLRKNGFDLFSTDLTKISEEEEDNRIVEPKCLLEILNKNSQRDQYDFIKAYFTDNEIKNVVNLVKENKIEKEHLIHCIENNLSYYDQNKMGLLCKELTENNLLQGYFFKLNTSMILLLHEQGYVNFYEQLNKESELTPEILKFTRNVLEFHSSEYSYDDFLIQLYEKGKWDFNEINKKIVCPSEQLLNITYTENQFNFICYYSNSRYKSSNGHFDAYMKKIDIFQEKYPSLIFHFKLNEKMEFNRFACFLGLFIDYKNEVNKKIDINKRMSEMGIISDNNNIIYSCLCGGNYESKSPYERVSLFTKHNGMYDQKIAPFLFEKILTHYISQEVIDADVEKVILACNNNELCYETKKEKILFYINKLSPVNFGNFIDKSPYLVIDAILNKKSDVLLPKVISSLQESGNTGIIRYLGFMNVQKKSHSEENYSHFKMKLMEKETEDLFMTLLVEGYEFLKNNPERVNDIKNYFDDAGEKIKTHQLSRENNKYFMNLFFDKLDLEKLSNSVSAHVSKKPERL